MCSLGIMFSANFYSGISSAQKFSTKKVPKEHMNVHTYIRAFKMLHFVVSMHDNKNRLGIRERKKKKKQEQKQKDGLY